MIKMEPETIRNFQPIKLKNSYLISFEGIEGCGKTTQIELLQQKIESYGFTCHIVREPGGTKFGESLRRAILETKEQISPLAEAHLFASSRAQLLEQVVLPLVNVPNNVVIYDRFIHSSIAYQGFGGELGPQKILEVHQHYPLNIIPHHTYYLNISIETSFKRQAIRNNKADYFESKSKEFYHKVKNGYESLSQIFSNYIYDIDSEGTIEDIENKIWNTTLMLLDDKQ